MAARGCDREREGRTSGRSTRARGRSDGSTPAARGGGAADQARRLRLPSSPPVASAIAARNEAFSDAKRRGGQEKRVHRLRPTRRQLATSSELTPATRTAGADGRRLSRGQGIHRSMDPRASAAPGATISSEPRSGSQLLGHGTRLCHRRRRIFGASKAVVREPRVSCPKSIATPARDHHGRTNTSDQVIVLPDQSIRAPKRSGRRSRPPCRSPRRCRRRLERARVGNSSDVYG